ncbi:galactose mutarotase [Balneolales bacterium ANBcel1]|nr:galactose mutarotase [Balneolales bacterium ANBcel1]
MTKNRTSAPASGIRPFGRAPGSETVFLITLKNKRNTTVSITNYGGIVTSIRVPDRDGAFANVVLGFDDFDSYLQPHPFFGALIGRYANRISDSSFTLNGQRYELTPSEGPNQLHGGPAGFDKVIWEFDNPDSNTLILTYDSPDGEEGFPGNLQVTVTYTLTDDNELKIDYRARSDRDTHVNLTNHSYFNLTGNPELSVLDHQLLIKAKAYTPVDQASIPTGEITPVAGTPFDFNVAKAIGRDINALENGYDHNYVLGDEITDFPKRVAVATDPSTGRKLETFTDKPGMQLYTGGGLSGDIGGPGTPAFRKFGGFCLETQFFPDSPNNDHFPSSVLKAGDEYRTTTIYRFSTQ